MKTRVNARFLLTSALMLFVMLLSACASNAAPSTTPPTAASASNPTQSAQKPLKVAILFSEKISGSAFDENAYQGLQMIHTQLGAQVADTENVQVPDIQNTLRNYASNGYQLVFGNGFEYGDPEIAIAKDYPNTDFVSITGNVSSTNVSSVDFAQGESGYVLGVLAGLMTKSNKIGVVAGQAYPSVIRYTEGIKLGAKSVNPNAKVTVVYINSWTDAGKGQEAARALVNDGCDILMHKADVVGQAVIKVAQDNHIFAIGDGPDQEKLAPDTVLTSGIASTPDLMLLVAKQVQDGTFVGNKSTPGFAAGVLSLAPFNTIVPADVQTKVNQVVDQIKSGQLKVPEITTQSQ
jgi:basic membrane protein A and related proteins